MLIAASLRDASHRPCGGPLRESILSLSGAHADLIESRTRAVRFLIGTGMNCWNKRFMRVPMVLYTSCVPALWNSHELPRAARGFKKPQKPLGGPCGSHRIRHARRVALHRNWNKSRETKSMHVPIDQHKPCVILWNPHELPTAARGFKNAQESLGSPCGSHKITHARRVAPHRNWHKSRETKSMHVPIDQHKPCVILWNSHELPTAARGFKKPQKPLGGPCGSHRITHARRVKPHRNWHEFLEKEIYACSYGALHELRARLYRIRISSRGAARTLLKCQCPFTISSHFVKLQK
jgi:hypothetical protein